MAGMMGMQDMNADGMSEKLDDMMNTIRQVNEQFKNAVRYSIQLFHAFVGYSQNYRFLCAVDDLMHCCQRPSGRGQQCIRSSTALREWWFSLII